MGIRISTNILEVFKIFVATNCEQYSYTKITVPIKLLKSPSDYDECIYYLDIIGDDFSQEQCYIGTQKIEELKIIRLKEADCEHNQLAEWKLEMIVYGGKTEEEIISLLDDLCTEFSLRFIRYYKYFQNSGFEGFSYDRFHLERKYAYEDKIFSENAMSMYCGSIEMKTRSAIERKVFKLPKKAKSKNENKDKFTDAFLKALRCKDKISRYILLYYLFEIMYATPQYQQLKNNFKSTSGTINSDTKRSLILFQYLQQEFDLNEYPSLGKTVILNAGTLEEIIKTRNDLTHRGDPTMVSTLMYNHLLPILQEVIRKL